MPIVSISYLPPYMLCAFTLYIQFFVGEEKFFCIIFLNTFSLPL